MFLPKNKFAVKCAVDKYDNVVHMVDGEMEQRLKDIDSVKFDVEEFDKAWGPFGIGKNDNGPNGMFNMMNPSYQEVLAVSNEISTYLFKHQDENTLITYLFAGHGMEIEGKQCFMLN